MREWDPSVDHVELVDGEARTESARYELEVSFRGRALTLPYRTVEVDPPRRVVFTAGTDSVSIRDEARIEPAGPAASTVTWNADLRLRGIRRVIDLLLWAPFRRIGRHARRPRRTPAQARPHPVGRPGAGMRRTVDPKRVAVVGAGVSGLVAAAELHRVGHDVRVFEAGGYAGGHANTIDVETPLGPRAVDTGFIVFNQLNYPNFERMLRELGIATQPADMSFSVSDGHGDFEWATTGPRGLFARPAHALDPRFHRMLRDLVRFNREARKLVGRRGQGPSLRRFLTDGGYSEYFVERLLVHRPRQSGPPILG